MSGPARSYRRARRQKQFKCDYNSSTLRCSFVCTQYDALSIHLEINHCCSACGGNFDFLPLHRPNCIQHGRGRRATTQPTGSIDILPFMEVKHALRGTLLAYSAPTQPPEECQVAAVFENVYYPLRKLLEALVAHFHGVKVSFRLIADMIEVTHGVEHIRDVIGSPFMPITHPNFIPKTVISSCVYVVNSLNAYLLNGSNWQIMKLRELQLLVGEYRPIRGRGYVPLPSELKRRRGLLSIKTNSHCFQLSVLCSLYEEEILEEARRNGNPMRGQKSKVVRSILENIKSYNNFLQKLDFSFLHCPDVALEDVDLVEDRFRDVSITVYGNVGKDVIVLRAPKQERDRHVNLLLVKHDQKKEYHYICIRDISGLLGTHNEYRHQYCPVCQKRFDSRTWSSVNHNCGETTTRAPNHPTVKFSRFDALLHSPFVIYYKFFFLNVQSQEVDEQILMEKIPVGFCLLYTGDETIKEYTHVGEDCVDRFFETAMELARNTIDKIKFTNEFVPPTEEQLRLHEAAENCEVCGKKFDQKDVVKAYHHCHQTGRKLQTCCGACNMQIKPKNLITAITLGGKNEFKYLQHKVADRHGAVTPIKRKEGTIMGFQVSQTVEVSSNFKLHFGVKFTDMENFRPDSSLDSLVAEMKSSREEFQVFETKCDQTGLSPESYLLGEEEESFPSFQTTEHFFYNKDTAFDKLTPVSISQRHPAQLTSLSLDNFIRRTLIAQASLIADAFRAMRRQYWKEFSLDLASFWGVPSFAREAALYVEKCELEPVFDQEISDRIDRGIFGGIIQTTVLKSIANSEILSNFNPDLPPVQFIYADQISCYSKPQMGNLPVDGYKVMTREELDNFDFTTADWDNNGWIFEVDLDYQSDEVRDWISDLPFPQERRRVRLSSLSSDQQRVYGEKEKPFVESERVLQTLFKKECQVYYGKLLKWMLEHGCVITRMYWGAKFREAPIFAKFSTNNVIARNEATSELERQTRKLLNNALYGQCLKRAADYPVTKTVKSSTEARRELSKHNFQGFEIIDEDTAVIELRKGVVSDVNLRMVGLAILSHSKINLLSHYYDGFKKQFGEKCRHVFTHTDSIAAEIHCSREEYLQGLKGMSERFDFSNLDPSHPLHFKGRTGIPGLLKIQSEGIKEFYSTSGTQYSMLIDPAFEENGSIIKAGGIARKQARQLRHEDFKRLVETGQAAEKIKVKTIRILENKMLSIENSHSSLSGINASRFFVSSTRSFPFGDRRINNYVEEEEM